MCKCNKGTRLPHSFACVCAAVIWNLQHGSRNIKKSRHRADPKNQSVWQICMCIFVTILQVALHRITVTVVRLLTVQPDCKTAGFCNLRQIILSSVIIYACHIKQSTDNHCASTMYFVEVNIALCFGLVKL